MLAKNAISNIKTFNWVILLILSALSGIFMHEAFTLGVILGGLIIIGNFSLLQNTLSKAFSNQGIVRTRKMALIIKFYFRLAIMGLIIYILITNGWVNPLGLAVGLSIVVLSILQLGIRAALGTSSREAL